MPVLVGSLGIFFFAIVTLLTMRLLQQAQRHVPRFTAVAAGLNIASFNLGTAVGGVLGSLTIAAGSLAQVPLVGALAATSAGAVLFVQARRSRTAGAAGA